MFHKFSDDDLRTYCKKSIESVELWGRRFVDELLRKQYGNNYFDHIKKSIREQAIKIQSTRSAHAKWIDCIFLDDLIALIANQEHFKLFRIALHRIYPHGEAEARFFLEKLIPVRNALSHANNISIRQAEQVVCYSNDFIDAIKEYYKEIGKEQMWNVPTIIKLTDSLGNFFTSMHNSCTNVFYKGDTYSISAEIDSSFDRAEYTIRWLRRSGHEFKDSHDRDKFTITFADEDINDLLSIRCSVISKKQWHKHDYCDDEKSVNMRVLHR